MSADGSGGGAASGSARPRVALETSKGKIVLELDAAKAPKTVANFLGYVRSGHYDGTIFHRVIRNFMIQGGGFDDAMRQKPVGAAIANEASNGLRNARGTVAMARTMDPHSATAQFFINTVDNRPLDYTASTPQGWGYAVFGKVVEGLDVVDAIEGVATTTRAPHRDVPAEPVRIVKATVVE
ncbi:MAG: peptidylprolyl isomerase [Thermoanaerobaculia bacterium]|nr:peptidylprolyl isomerase [Thermoanaerobaculia bacterium]